MGFMGLLVMPRNRVQLPRAVAYCSLLIAAAFLTGCAGIPNTLPSDDLAQVERTRVKSYFPQSTAQIQYMRSGYGAGIGLIGAVVDASVTGAMAGHAKSRADQLQEAVSDLDVRGEYWSAISNVLRETAWLKLESMDMQASNVVRVRAEDIEGHCLMNLGTDYMISADMRVFHITTGMGFYIAGKHKKPSASITMVYHSSRITDKEGDEALELWIAKGGEIYRRLAQEGISESVRMLGHGLNIMGDGDQSSYRPATVRARLVHGRGDFGIPTSRLKLKGLVLEKNTDRVLFKADKGAIYSFPLGEVEIELAGAN